MILKFSANSVSSVFIRWSSIFLMAIPASSFADTQIGPLTPAQRDAVLKEIAQLTETEIRKIPDFPIREATPERLEALYQAPDIAQVPKDLRRFGLILAARGGTHMFDFEKPSDVLSQQTRWFPEATQKAQAKNSTGPFHNILGPDSNWTREAIAFTALWHCMPRIAWLKPNQSPFMRDLNDGGWTAFQGQHDSTYNHNDNSEFLRCLSSGLAFHAGVIEKGRVSGVNNPVEDSELSQQLADKIAPFLAAKFEHFLTTYQCRGTGPDDCVLVLRLWGSLFPADPRLAATIQSLEPAVTQQPSLDRQGNLNAALRKAAFLQVKLLSVLRAPRTWPDGALAATFRQMSDLDNWLPPSGGVCCDYIYSLNHNRHISPWEVLGTTTDEQPQIRRIIFDGLGKVDIENDCGTFQRWLKQDESLLPEYVLHAWRTGKFSACATRETAYWHWLRKGATAKAVELRGNYLEFAANPESGYRRDEILYFLTKDGADCFDAKRGEAGQEWLDTACRAFISERPDVNLRLAHTGLALTARQKFVSIRQSPPLQPDQSIDSSRQQAWLVGLVNSMGGKATEQMQDMSSDWNQRKVIVSSATQWTNRDASIMLLWVRRDTSKDADLLFLVNAMGIIPIRIPERFHASAPGVVEVSDLDTDGNPELWMSDSYRSCSGDEGDLHRNIRCTATSARMGEVQNGILSYFANAAASAVSAVARGRIDELEDTTDEITGRDDRPCNRLLLGTLLSKPLRINFGSTVDGDNQRGDIIDLVCKPHPEAPQQLVIALFHDLAGTDKPKTDDGLDTKGFVLAVFDMKQKKLLSTYRERFEEDGTTRISDFSLRLDTGRYYLKPGVRAIGVRMNISHSPRCAEGGSENELSLFVTEGAKLRPVLKQLPMRRWSVVKGSPCSDDTDLEIDQQVLTLSIANTTTDGWRDIDVVYHRPVDPMAYATPGKEIRRHRLRMKAGLYQ